jgi:hypothetical protein
MMAELAPKTAYQTRLAEQLVDYEWEIDRHRRLRDFCLLGAVPGARADAARPRTSGRALQGQLSQRPTMSSSRVTS